MLYLSNWYFQPESNTEYEVDGDNPFLYSIILSISTADTASALFGETNATQSFLSLAILKQRDNVPARWLQSPVINNEISDSSAFWNKLYAVM